jgi:hypothetical protein
MSTTGHRGNLGQKNQHREIVVKGNNNQNQFRKSQCNSNTWSSVQNSASANNTYQIGYNDRGGNKSVHGNNNYGGTSTIDRGNYPS